MHTPFLNRKESVSLLYKEEAGSSLNRRERASFLSIYRRQTAYLYRRESVSFLYVEEADPSIYRERERERESVFLLYVE